MPRPRKEGLDYFSHDVDTANDEKIEAMTSLYGANGYAFYFILLERIYRCESGEMDISDADTIKILSKKCLATHEQFEAMLATALKLSLFDHQLYSERKVLTSHGIKKRLEPVLSKRARMKDLSQKKVSAAETGAETPRQEIVSAEETPAITPQSIVKHSTEKNSTAKERKEQHSSIPAGVPGGAVAASPSEDLEQVVYDRVGWKKRLSRADWDKVISLKTRHPPDKFWDAMNQLHGGVNNVPAFLTAVLEHKEKPDERITTRSNKNTERTSTASRAGFHHTEKDALRFRELHDTLAECDRQWSERAGTS